MKTESFNVSRTIESGTSKVERAVKVNFRSAETVDEMLALSGGDLSAVVKTFNDGRWATFRTKVSNTLSGQTEEQRAVAKMVSAMKALQPTLSEEQVRSLVLSMPGISEAAGNSVSPLPAEIDDTYNFSGKDSTEGQAAA